MSRRGESDASLPVGLVLGIFIGAALAVILEPHRERRSASELDEALRRSEQALSDKKTQVRAELDNLYKGTPIKPKDDLAKARAEMTQAQQQAHDAHAGVQKAQEQTQMDVDKARQELAKTEEKAHETHEAVGEAQEKLRDARDKAQE